MSQGKLITVSTLAATQFRAAILQNAGAQLNLNVASQGLSKPAECRVKSVRIVSVQNLGWEVQLYRRDTFQHATDPDADRFAGRWTFVAADAVQVGGAGLYHYYIDGNDIDYTDEDQTSEFHLLLIPRDGAKSADAAGAVRVELVVELGLGR